MLSLNGVESLFHPLKNLEIFAVQVMINCLISPLHIWTLIGVDLVKKNLDQESYMIHTFADLSSPTPFRAWGPNC